MARTFFRFCMFLIKTYSIEGGVGCTDPESPWNRREWATASSRKKKTDFAKINRSECTVYVCLLIFPFVFMFLVCFPLSEKVFVCFSSALCIDYPRTEYSIVKHVNRGVLVNFSSIVCTNWVLKKTPTILTYGILRDTFIFVKRAKQKIN